MTVIYTAGLVVAGFPGAEFRPGALAVEGGRIIAVGDVASVRDAAPEARVVELGDAATVVPGLVDTHVHLVFDGSADPVGRLEHADDIERLAIMLRSARELLSAGVTTARDLGAPGGLDARVKQLIRQGLARGPRLQSVTAPLTVTGGHCWFFGGECDGVDGVRRAVRAARRDGADAIKVMATGGKMTPGTLPSEPQFTQEELCAIVDEAHKYGLRVTAHAHGGEGIRRAIEAGADAVEHFSFATADDTFVEDPAVVQLAVDAGTYATKTFCGAVFGPYRESFPVDMMRSLSDRGVKLVVGSDAGIPNAQHREAVYGLEGMAAFGMTNAEVLHAATARGAESLGLADETGSLEPGKAADFLVVAGDPRDDLRALRSVSLVVAQGEEYVPEFPSLRAWDDDAYGPRYAGGVR